MPSEDFYSGLALPEQLHKFMDWHSDPRQRHISQAEVQILDRAVERLRMDLKDARREAKEEQDEVFEMASQSYETVIYRNEVAVSVHSFPVRHLDDPVAVLQDIGLKVVAEDPSERETQDILASLLLSSQLGGLESALAAIRGRSPDLEAELSVDSTIVLNRLLYQPAVPAENSWADFASLGELLEEAKQSHLPIYAFVGSMGVSGGDVWVAFLAGGSVLALQLAGDVRHGMRGGLSDLGRRLTRRWEIPDDPDEETPSGEPGDG